MRRNQGTGLFVLILIFMIISLAGLSVYIAMRDISRQSEQDELFSRADQVCDEYDRNLRESVSGGKASSEDRA